MIMLKFCSAVTDVFYFYSIQKMSNVLGFIPIMIHV